MFALVQEEKRNGCLVILACISHDGSYDGSHTTSHGHTEGTSNAQAAMWSAQKPPPI
jgi:hypothetical protein